MDNPSPPLPRVLDYGVRRRRRVDGIRLLALLLPPLTLVPLGVWVLYLVLFSGKVVGDDDVFLISFGAVCVAFGLGFPVTRLVKPRLPVAQRAEDSPPPRQFGPADKRGVLDRMWGRGPGHRTVRRV